MKLSLITPTHLKNSNLGELYSSILSQEYQDWEWILFLNGGAHFSQISEKIRNDSRVKIHVNHENNPCVGYNKNKAFLLGTGEVLIEIDHDDMITPDCLTEVAKAFKDERIGFVYSDAAVLKEDGEFVPFNPVCGWTYSKMKWEGKELISMDSFPATSHSVAFIWFAPDHVRAWRSDVYREIGGHNPELSICDDHELMVRTYLQTKMLHIPKPLYIYRITGANTWIERSASIQLKTVEIFEQYAWELAVHDAQLNNLYVVNLGEDEKEGCINIKDFKFGIPLPDNSVGVLNASHILQKMPNPKDSMNEIHRVLADGGWAFIEVPSTDGRGAWQDPTHVSFWNENSFWYYTKDNYISMINNEGVKFQRYSNKTIWWDDNIAVTQAILFADKEPKHRPKM